MTAILQQIYSKIAAKLRHCFLLRWSKFNSCFKENKMQCGFAPLLFGDVKRM